MMELCQRSRRSILCAHRGACTTVPAVMKHDRRDRVASVGIKAEGRDLRARDGIPKSYSGVMASGSQLAVGDLGLHVCPSQFQSQHSASLQRTDRTEQLVVAYRPKQPCVPVNSMLGDTR